jgi:hypothetical protein
MSRLPRDPSGHLTYDLHITRREHWWNEGNDIAPEEWLAYVPTDSELTLRPSMGPYVCTWAAAGRDTSYILDWVDGCIFADGSDTALLCKLIGIARALNARVRGDAGEIYESPREPPRDP